MSRRNGNPAAAAYGLRQKKVHDLLSQAMAKAAGDTLMVTEWLDEQDGLEGYGYTTELEETIAGLEKEATDVAELFPNPGHHFKWDTFLEGRTLAEQLQLEEFLHGLVAARKSCRPVEPRAETQRVVFDPIAQELRALRDILNNSPDEGGDTERKALFLIRNWDTLPLAALEWIVRVEKGEEPPATPEHVSTLVVCSRAKDTLSMWIMEQKTPRPLDLLRVRDQLDAEIRRFSIRP